MREREGVKIPGPPKPVQFGNGHTLARVEGPLGLAVTLDIETWEHIQSGHPEIDDLEEVKRTLSNPNLVQRSFDDANILFYYRLMDSGPKQFRGLFMAVVVRKKTDSEGSAKTAYLRRKTKLGGELLWMKR